MEQVPTCLQVPWRQSAKILPADGTNLKTIVTAGTTNQKQAPTKVIGVVVSNNDTITHDVMIGIADSTNVFISLGTVTIPINAGFVGSIPSVNMLNSIPAPLDETGQPYLFLNSTDILQIKCTTNAVNTGKEIDVVCFGADF
jgi:hypothetical protein